MTSIHTASQRELELELIRVRAEARAARLEAQAAELELMLRRMASETPSQESGIDGLHRLMPSQTPHADFASRTHSQLVPAGWEQRVQLLQARKQSTNAADTTLSATDTAINWQTGAIDLARIQASPSAPTIQSGNRFAAEAHSIFNSLSTDSYQPKASGALSGDSQEAFSSSQADLGSVTSNAQPANDQNGVNATTSIDTNGNASILPSLASEQESTPLLRIDTGHALPSAHHESLDAITLSRSTDPVTATGSASKAMDKPTVAPKQIAIQHAASSIATDDDAEERVRWRPASWMLSTVAHVVVLVVLASMSLAVSPPKDQLAFSGSAGESNEEVMENFQIETSEPMQPAEPTVAETAYDVSEFGTLPITEVNVDLPPAMVTPDTQLFSELSSSSMSAATMKSLKGEPGPKMQFCGVDGGGNHFVYLVDSSNSMGEGFQSARAELLASIDQLKPEQRFYVVFFDEQPDFMRISDPQVDEEASVMATPENKKRLRQWAMDVEMNKGKAPYEVLPFVLKLRPDVIFLLSDGEFPERIGQILQEQNRQENLFGESGPISIVHTIRYHGREGEEGRRAEATMVSIAKENSGQYRHVPKPKSK